MREARRQLQRLSAEQPGTPASEAGLDRNGRLHGSPAGFWSLAVETGTQVAFKAGSGRRHHKAIAKGACIGVLGQAR